MIASEVERVRAPERASETAAADFLRAMLQPRADRARRAARAGARAVAGRRGRRQHDRRARPPAGAHRRGLARARARRRRARRAGGREPLDRRAVRARRDRPAPRCCCSCPAARRPLAARAADAVLREMEAGLSGYTFALGRSRIAEDPAELPRAASEALLAANVAQGSRRRRRRSRSSRPAPTGCCCRR